MERPGVPLDGRSECYIKIDVPASPLFHSASLTAKHRRCVLCLPFPPTVCGTHSFAYPPSQFSRPVYLLRRPEHNGTVIVLTFITGLCVCVCARVYAGSVAVID